MNTCSIGVILWQFGVGQYKALFIHYTFHFAWLLVSFFRACDSVFAERAMLSPVRLSVVRVDQSARTLSYRKDDRAMRPILWVPCNISRSILRMCVQNFNFVALPAPEIIGGTEKISAVPGYHHAPFSPIFFHGLLFGCTLWMYRPNLQSVALAVPEIIAIAVLGWVANNQSWGRGGHKGSEMVPFERAFLTSRLSIVTFPLSLPVSEILPLLCFSTPLCPTPPLVSPKFPHVPLGLGGWPLD